MAQTVEDLEAQRLEAEKQAQDQVEAAAAVAQVEAEEAGLSKDEVNRAVEKARKEEKDKLYPQIEELKAAVKEVQQTLREEREEKEEIKKKAEEEAEKARQSKLSDSEKQLEAIRGLEEKLTKEAQERTRIEKEWRDARHEDQLAKYRNRAIQAAGVEPLADLITGVTEKEIDENIKIAKARFEEIAERVKAESGKRVRESMPGSTYPDTEAAEEAELERSLSQVDHDRYLSDPDYRVTIQEEIARAYTRAAGQS